MKRIKRLALLAAAVLLATTGAFAGTERAKTGAAGAAAPAAPAAPAWIGEAGAELLEELGAGLDADGRVRLWRGLKQVAVMWRAEDGDAAAFEDFVRKHFAKDQDALDAMFERFETLLEPLDGHLQEVGLAFNRQSDLDLGPILPLDELFAAFDASAHVDDDLFGNKLAFVVLLNFPLTSLEDRLRGGPEWTRRQWAEARLALRFRRRVPAEVNQAMAVAASKAAQYVSSYNIWMHHVVDAQGRRLFPKGMKLLSHWNLRDQLRSEYEAKGGLARQRVIRRIMDRIVDQSIPQCVVDNPGVDWEPFANQVRPSPVADGDEDSKVTTAASPAPEPDTRYATLLDCFRACRLVDPYSPGAPTHLARSFEEGREIPEVRVKAILEQLLGSPLVRRTAALVRRRLGRPLEPFDIWYQGFKPSGGRSEAELDALTKKRYPTVDAYHAGIPDLLERLGFTAERARFFAANILVEPARGSGHATGTALRSSPVRLRTRVGKDGMDYKGFNIAIHEMGHNVEQVVSGKLVDHYLLSGVPNTAFTEALAFWFQGKDLELLGVARPDPDREALEALHEFWGTVEIAGVGLMDIGVWRWMYAHPDATPAELKAAVIAVAKDVWNRWFAPHMGVRDIALLAVYSHLVDSFLYLPDYPLGHLICCQFGERLRGSKAPGADIEAMMKVGNVAPDQWMRAATGAPVGPEAMLRAAERALRRLERGRSVR